MSGMNASSELAARIFTDPSLEAARQSALARMRADWTSTAAAVRANDRETLRAHLGRDVPDGAAIAVALMHAEICPDCAGFPDLMAAAGAAFARQVFGWYGLWAAPRPAPGSPSPQDRLAHQLDGASPILVARLPAELDALAGRVPAWPTAERAHRGVRRRNV